MLKRRGNLTYPQLYNVDFMLDMLVYTVVLNLVLVMMVTRRLSATVFEHLGPATVDAADTTREVDAK